MVIGTAGCDNVDWGGLDLSVVPPPPTTGPTSASIETGDRLPEGPILYYVTRDSARATVIPVAEIVDDGMAPIITGADAQEFGDRFIAAFLREGAELTLFRRGRRAGTLVVESASVPSSGVCRRLPRATGRIELGNDVGGAGEFLAMARTQAPQGRVIPGDSLEPERRMQVVGNILAERALRARSAPLPNWTRARRQLQPFPVSGAGDPGFTATFLLDDELQVGNDDQGYSLFIVYTPQAQTGYDTAYVDYVSYTAAGKAAPRTIDFLDWDRDGSAELLLDVYGTRTHWFEAIGQGGDGWERILSDRCDEGATTLPPAPDSASADSAAAPTEGGPARTTPAGGTPPARSTPAAPAPATRRPATPPDTGSGGGVPDVEEPRVQLSVPGPSSARTRPATPPDTGAAGTP